MPTLWRGRVISLFALVALVLVSLVGLFVVVCRYQPVLWETSFWVVSRGAVLR